VEHGGLRRLIPAGDVEQLARDIWLHRVDAEGFPTAGAVVLTRRRAFVIDTLTRPADMEPARALLRDEGSGRRLVVINTHHHWDHVYGNAAFAGEDIVAHHSCPGLLAAQLSEAGGSPPPRAGVPLPCLTFDTRLDYADGAEVVRLIHAPGHSADSVVVFLNGARVLFAGDALEWPLPSIGRDARVSVWLRTMAMLRELDAGLIVPSHGPAMGRELLDANERYLTGLVAAVSAANRAGARPPDLDLPATRFVAPGVEIGTLYHEVHAANVIRVWKEV
jgi:glyoxylase-like metal-dependent hydrolase (beta-lactamase superfamily II)